MDSSDTGDGGPADAAVTDGADLIADQFDVLVVADRWLEEELRRIKAGCTSANQVTVNRLVALGERMRPAAAVRARLARIEPTLFTAGVRIWAARQSPEDPESAAARAHQVWTGDTP
jgi:hypothetical protein